jgi:hypothetical protein
MQLMYHRDHSEKNLLIYDENVEFDVFSNNESASCIDLGLVLGSCLGKIPSR